MAYFSYDVRVPDDTFTPKVHTQDELDAMQIPADRRDDCKDFYATFKKCIMVVHQTNPRSVMAMKRKGRDNCGYYFDHWNQCREV